MSLLFKNKFCHPSVWFLWTIFSVSQVFSPPPLTRWYLSYQLWLQVLSIPKRWRCSFIEWCFNPGMVFWCIFTKQFNYIYTHSFWIWEITIFINHQAWFSEIEWVFLYCHKFLLKQVLWILNFELQCSCSSAKSFTWEGFQSWWLQMLCYVVFLD